ncbi:hypothetical protein IAQ61_009508 [Plenodomus lingam]|uniref:uncharacterized protein n=1 Tax=Leptosphaeria maculans TaxID=5022 RepID=UPI00331FEA1C|nr:hypothetical protein IAQ61_009508 [Plenodomus lingam]
MRSGFEATTTLPSRLGNPVLSTKEAPDQCTKPAIVGCRFRPVADSQSHLGNTSSRNKARRTTRSRESCLLSKVKIAGI